MTTRRAFIKSFTAGLGGVVFTGCCLKHSLAYAANGSPKRREIIIGGKRAKVVDMHAHCAFPDTAAMMGQQMEAPTLEMADDRIRAMDAQGIDMQVLSINPTWYSLDGDTAIKVCDLQNEKLAGLCAAKPDRFMAFGSLALQVPEIAVEQLETAVKHHGLKGAAIGDNVAGVDFSDQRFNSVWAKAEELGVPLFIHPQGAPELSKRLQGNGNLPNVIGNPLGTTIALSHLIFEGTLDRFPRLKILAAHGGGYLPSYADRSDHACLQSPAKCAAGPVLKKRPTEYLRQIYFDSLIFSSEALRHLAFQVGKSQIVLGTDYPFGWTSTAVEHIMTAEGFNNADRLMMLGGTAQQLLGLKAA
ncbi:amidohydrolase family protein [Bradyrhizobium sp. 187]|uniref:amidohydrolase family protein n=1 Tax=Bradyrhizobium sp. 187 TaxID=2782655 RepID=UPI001FFEA19F|nr:amidohydrolase family protein [Bradyrhizobium sp. 187]UPJ71868.1 amidohydrolase family protein [Bradyrhizobium sp. 187]